MPWKLRLGLALRPWLRRAAAVDLLAQDASASFSVILPHETNNGASAPFAPNAAIRVQASATVPPQVESITPTGTCSRLSISRAKYHATAEKSFAVSGVEAAQPASSLDVRHRIFNGLLLDHQQPDIGIVRLRQVRIRSRRLVHRELHVRLTRSNPHIADQNVIELDHIHGSRGRASPAAEPVTVI